MPLLQGGQVGVKGRGRGVGEESGVWASTAG